MLILCHSRALRVRTAEFEPLGSAFEGHGSLPLLNNYVCKPTEFKDDICTDYFQNVIVHASPPLHTYANYITNSNKTFRSRSRGSLIGSDSWLVATTPGDSNSDSAPLVFRLYVCQK